MLRRFGQFRRQMKVGGRSFLGLSWWVVFDFVIAIVAVNSGYRVGVGDGRLQVVREMKKRAIELDGGGLLIPAPVRSRPWSSEDRRGWELRNGRKLLE